jgi:hypothetical protein
MNLESQNYTVFDDMTESEKVVADFLARNGMWWNFEQPIYVKDDRGRPRVWSPDFYVPRLGIHIEVVGNNSANYSYREQVYQQNSIPVIFVYPNKDGWQQVLLDSIRLIHQDRWQIIKRFSDIL